jgi:peptidoglycan hydrolase CwlO-like protein
MTIRIFYVQILSLFLLSCSTSTPETAGENIKLTPQQQELKDLENRVLRIHDEVMPLMGSLIVLKEKVEDLNKELASSGTAEAADQVIINDMIINNLDQAHESMMSWMRNYKPIDIETDLENNKAFLEDQESKINSVKKEVYGAMLAAQELLKESQI